MSMPADLIVYLKTKATLNSLVGGRFSMNTSGQMDNLPRIVIERITDDHQHHLTAASGMAITMYQLTCHAESTLSAVAVAEQLRLAIDGYRGEMGATRISMCHLKDQRDGYDPPVDASGIGTFNVQQDYLIGHAVSVSAFA